MTPAPVGLRCPEHAGRQRVVRPAQRAFRPGGLARGATAVTWALIALNTAVYLGELAVGGGFNGQNNWIYEHGALFASGAFSFGQPVMGVAHGEWWRLVTAAFLHYGPIHLGLNMLALYFGGQILALIVINLVFTFAVPGISIGGHVGGLIAGFVLMYAMTHFARSAELSVLTTVAVVAVSVVVAYAQVRGYS